jgi:tetratricopeptide (TPR) repeat protein
VNRPLAALVLLGCLAATAAARADDVQEAKARFRHAVELYKQQQWREAMAEFEAAYRLKPHGAIHFNVAQCRERLEEWPGALRSYHDYLREVPNASDRAAVRKATLRIEERLARAGVQVLVVYSEPPGASVAVDGLPRGTAPVHVVLQPGSYALAVSLEGHERVTQKVELAPGGSRLVEVVLKPLPRAVAPPVAATAAAAATPSTAPDLAARPAAEPKHPVPAAPPARPRRHLPSWIAAGTALAAAAAGVWLGASARADARAIDALSEPDPGTASRRARDAESKARTANLLFGLAGGAAAASVGLYVLEARF